MNWLNYHHLLYFYTIATEKSVTAAAARLRIGQPALSAQLKALEKNLGHPLFERRNRKLILTEMGKIVFDYADEIFRLGKEMIETISDRPGARKIHLSIGALDGVAKQMVHRLVDFAYSSGPCFISLFEGEGETLLRGLESHQLDLVITNSPAPIAPMTEYRSRLIAEYEVGLFGSSNFKHLKSKFPKSLTAQPVIYPTRHSKLRRDFEQYLESHKISVQAVGETQDVEVLKRLSVSGLGLIPISVGAVKEEIENGSLHLIGKIPSVTEQIWLTSASRKIENPLALKIMKQFKL